MYRRDAKLEPQHVGKTVGQRVIQMLNKKNGSLLVANGPVIFIGTLLLLRIFIYAITFILYGIL